MSFEKQVITRSYRIKTKCIYIFYYEWIIVAPSGIDNFKITKFHKEHECNLLRLNINNKECNSYFIVN